MKYLPKLFASFALLSGLFLATSCEDSGSGGPPIAEGRDVNTVVCIGDSITAGYACDGAPWPSHLAGKSGKNVINLGIGGATASAAPSAARNAISRNPGYVCILYGANDAIHGRDPNSSKEALRAAIAACKEAGVRPIIGTPTPMRDGHALFNGNAKAIAEAIRALASEEGVQCVDLYGSFGDGSGLLTSDGLHTNPTGAEKIASGFAGAL